MPLNDPIGSTSLDVLQRNAQDVDRFVNQTSGTVTNRNGTQITPLPVIAASAQQLIGNLETSTQSIIENSQAQLNAAVLSTGWFIVGEFSAGFEFTARNQVGRDSSGELWSYNGSLPFTVPPATVPSEPDYTNRGDAALRSELNANNLPITVVSLKVLSDAPLVANIIYNTMGFYLATSGGSASYRYEPSASKEDHNGVTVIAPEALEAWDGTAGDRTTLFGWTGTGDGCFVLINSLPTSKFELDASVAGLLDEDSSSISIQAAVDCLSSGVVILSNTSTLADSPIQLRSNVTLKSFVKSKILQAVPNQYCLLGSSLHNIKVVGVGFDGNSQLGDNASGAYSLVDCVDVEVRGCELTGFASSDPGVIKQSAANMVDCSEIVITNNKIDGGGFRGFSLFSCTKAQIKDNLINSCENTAISVRGRFVSVSSGDMSETIISGNIITNISSENGVSDGAIDVYTGADRVIVHKNIVTGFGSVVGSSRNGSAIRLNMDEETDDVPTKAVISHNICTGGDQGGDGFIRVNRVRGVIISDNICHAKSGTEYNYIISSRQISGVTEYVNIYSNVIDIENDVVINDSVIRCDSNNYLVSSNVAKIKSTVTRGIRLITQAQTGQCTNNSFDASGTLSSTAIAANIAQLASNISDNRMRGFINGLSASGLNDSRVKGNRLTGPGFVSGQSGTSLGITSSAAIVDSIISDNRIGGYWRSALSISSSTDSSYFGNIITNCGLNDSAVEYNMLIISAGEGNTISRNRFRLRQAESKANILIQTAADDDIIEDNDLRTGTYNTAISATGTGTIQDRNRD